MRRPHTEARGQNYCGCGKPGALTAPSDCTGQCIAGRSPLQRVMLPGGTRKLGPSDRHHVFDRGSGRARAAPELISYAYGRFARAPGMSLAKSTPRRMGTVGSPPRNRARTGARHRNCPRGSIPPQQGIKRARDSVWANGNPAPRHSPQVGGRHGTELVRWHRRWECQLNGRWHRCRGAYMANG